MDPATNREILAEIERAREVHIRALIRLLVWALENKPMIVPGQLLGQLAAQITAQDAHACKYYLDHYTLESNRG